MREEVEIEDRESAISAWPAIEAIGSHPQSGQFEMYQVHYNCKAVYMCAYMCGWNKHLVGRWRPSHGLVGAYYI